MRLILALVALLICCAAPKPAMAQSCTISISNINFGTISGGTGTGASSSGTLSALCIGTPNATVTICPNINDGTGGSSAGSPRYIKNGTSSISYNLLQSNGQVWGSYTWPYAPRPPVLTLQLNALGFATMFQPVNAAIVGPIGPVPTGVYLSSYGAGQTLFDYGYAPNQNCSAISNRALAVNFTVQANLTASCTVTTSPMNFGTVQTLTTAIGATGQLGVSCSQGAPYSISLDYGSNGGTGPTAHMMATSGSAQKLNYGVYQDAGHNLPWGQTSGLNTVTNTGTGSQQNFNVYGYLPAQGNPAVGTYTDTVIVSVNF